ncbi:TonB-dependent siderophore receptor [Massilia sp. Dwa41.01b]|uniref:TonB-dependent siderophore receptor n=1 Tax=unclassified Massilia TaxID=2609279 RepID=UPI001603E98E|nr:MULTISPECIES: TonB-dependent siderophore receptor [unclassified Massilia]QNA89637.1 TonB-dependent siderophore receptor [Massilia sp. Dwa41.01b]QNB00538.1 TonB-dependent siderophore receptor [Massilia sp. Se16.2.3]
MKPVLKHTLLACALAQAFTIDASAQTQEPVASVLVTGNKWTVSDRAGIGGFADLPIVETPVSVSAITREQMQNLSIRSATDALAYDASVGDAYNAVGYAEQFSVRGFMLNNNSGYRKDGIVIPADTQIPLENKERLELLKGVAGMQAGLAAPGGILNFVTKRPTNTPLRSVTFEARERGTLYGALDLGGRFDDRRFGYRVNAAAERLRSYVDGADGKRQFVSGAFDWQITPDALLQLDMDFQHKEQITAPGYQLIRGVALPANISAKTLLNAQPWTRPVDTDSANFGLRFDYRINSDWRATVAANKHWFKRDDFTAFPYGCSNEGEGFYPGYCSNGDYDVYDYQSVGERKTPFGIQAQLQGRVATGALRHVLTVGTSYSERHNRYGDYVYDYAGSSNIYQNQVVDPAPGNPATGPVSERFTERERSLFVQDILTLTPELALHAGLRYVKIDTTQLPEPELGWVNSRGAYVLPSVSLVYGVTPSWNVYATFARGLDAGGVADMGTNNENTDLGQNRSKQVELGTKGSFGDVAFTAALFQITKGFEFDEDTGLPKPTFVRKGEQVHRGFELAAQRTNGALTYGATLMALRARQEDTGSARYDGKRVTNVPELKTTLWADYAVAAVPGLKVSGQWQYAGEKSFDPENTVNVPGYHVFGLGASYGVKMGATSVTLRARVDNLTDKFYWRDVTQELGGYLLPGAPRTFRMSAQFDF